MAVYTLADEIARKKAAGEDRNYGKKPVTPVAATTPMPATPKATGGVVPPLANPNLNPYTNGPNAVFGAGGAASAIPKAATPSAGGVIPPLTGPSPVNGTQGVAANSTTQGVIPQFTPNPLAPSLNQSQIEYINKKFGSLDNYVNKQDSRYNEALVTGNNGLLDALSKDSTRLGYTLHDQFREQAEAKAAKEYEDAKIKADAQKESLQNNFNYGRQNINDSRVLQDSQFNRSVNPFSGRKGYLQAQTERGRSIDDTMANSALQSQLNEIDSGLGNIDQNEMADELYNSLLSSARGQAIDTAKLTGKFGGVDTLDAENQHFNQDTKMAELTGFLPDGTKTTAQQQKDLENLWSQADYTGVVPDQLASLYGIPKGTQTQKAKEFAQQLSISQQNANTSRQSSNNASGNANFSKLMDVFAATGKAPAGLEGYGIKAGDDYKSYANKDKPVDYNSDPRFANAVQGISSDSNALATITSRAEQLINDFGFEGYQALVELATPKKQSTSDLFSQLFAQ